MEGIPEADGFGDGEIVDAVVRDLEANLARWEADLAAAEAVTFSVDMGDIQAVANADGKLIELILHPDAMVIYGHSQLAERLNIAFEALRAEALREHEARYGDGLL